MNPVVVSTWGSPKKYLAAFLETARRVGIEPQNFDNSDWPGATWDTIEWFRKSEGQARYVREHASEFSHFIFCDSYDVIWAAGLDEIMEKYWKLNSPIVWAAECYPWPKPEQATLYPTTPHRCKYLNGGFWIGETQAALKMLEDIAFTAAKREQCDQGIAVDLFLSKRHPIELDRTCSMCFCCNIDSLDYLTLTPGSRPKTKDTNEEPCLFHGNGASDLRGICANIAP